MSQLAQEYVHILIIHNTYSQLKREELLFYLQNPMIRISFYARNTILIVDMCKTNLAQLKLVMAYN
jgi:hypothetical protein